MALGMKIKEKMIREFMPSGEDIEEVGEKLDDILEIIKDAIDSLPDEEGGYSPRLTYKNLNKAIENIGYIKKALGLR